MSKENQGIEPLGKEIKKEDGRDEIDPMVFPFLSTLDRHLIIQFRLERDRREEKMVKKNQRCLTREEGLEIVRKAHLRIPGSEKAMNYFMWLYNTIQSSQVNGEIH